MSNSAIAVPGLRKAYGDKIVLDGGTVRVAGHDIATETKEAIGRPRLLTL